MLSPPTEADHTLYDKEGMRTPKGTTEPVLFHWKHFSMT
jgi:hypothetical protein